MVEQDLRTAKPEDSVGEFGNDALAELIDTYARQAEHFSRLAFGARRELLARLLDDGATVLDTERWAGRVKPGQITHRVEDPVRLHERLSPFLQAKELVAAFVQPPPPPLRVDQRVLNDLHKRGGDIARIIEEERVSVRGDSTLELSRKEGAGDGRDDDSR